MKNTSLLDFRRTLDRLDDATDFCDRLFSLLSLRLSLFTPDRALLLESQTTIAVLRFVVYKIGIIVNR